jgi:hypothetical protein
VAQPAYPRSCYHAVLCLGNLAQDVLRCAPMCVPSSRTHTRARTLLYSPPPTHTHTHTHTHRICVHLVVHSIWAHSSVMRVVRLRLSASLINEGIVAALLPILINKHAPTLLLRHAVRCVGGLAIPPIGECPVVPILITPRPPISPFPKPLAPGGLVR